MSLSAAFLDEVRARTVLSGLVARDVKLVRAGREMRGCCPFHNEKSPSFYVNDAKGFYHCFGCSAHGDAIKWMTDHKGLSFLDAVRDLAAAAGLDMPARDEKAAEQDALFERSREILHRAAQFYMQALRSDQGAVAREYAKSRGISAEIIETFSIGFAPDGRRGEPSPLAHFLRDVATDQLIELGLMKASDNGRAPYDFFRNRLIVPIHDARGRVIGFGGRTLGTGEPKYLNSPETSIFHKGQTLFNIHRAAPVARKRGRLVIVEGYLDVIAMARAGVLDAAAPNGTALTERQLQDVWRHAAAPICCMDGDKAGRAAAVRAAKLALPMIEPGKTLTFAFPPAGMDPDDLLTKHGPGAVAELLSSPRSLSEIIWEHELEAAGSLAGPEARAGLLKRLQIHAESIKDRNLGYEFWRDFKDRFAAHLRRAEPATSHRQTQGRVAIAVAIEAAIVLGLLSHPDVARSECEFLATLAWSDQVKPLVDLVMDLEISGRLNHSSIDVEIEKRGLTVSVKHFRSLAQIPFSFLGREMTLKSSNELRDAIYRMPRK